MSNNDFVNMMNTGLHGRQPWSKVRWINIGGISWDVMSALAIKYGRFQRVCGLCESAINGFVIYNQTYTRLHWKVF